MNRGFRVAKVKVGALKTCSLGHPKCATAKGGACRRNITTKHPGSKTRRRKGKGA